MDAARHPVPELLAPAGSMEALRAAVANGADAVYLGLPAFNARLRAANFTPAQLQEARELTLRCNVRLYVTMNTLLHPAELDDAQRSLESLASLPADALIVQDPGLAELAHRLVPSLPLHASTQMTLSEPLAIAAAQRRWNIARVILPRETSIPELAEIRRRLDALPAEPAETPGSTGPRPPRTPVELEVFVHGALCISYSGQCHASRCLGGRSGNRGACAQPCRLAWALYDGERPVRAEGPHLLSPQDLCLLDRLGDLVAAGASCLKIEGRAKTPHYVAAAVAAYRRALDALSDKGRPLECSGSPPLLGDRSMLTHGRDSLHSPSVKKGASPQGLLKSDGGSAEATPVGVSRGAKSGGEPPHSKAPPQSRASHSTGSHSRRPPDSDRYALHLTFSRGFTEGYADGPAPARLVDASVTGDLGLRIGTVDRVGPTSVVVRLDGPDHSIAPGDGVAFGRHDETGRRVGSSVYAVTPAGEGGVRIELDNAAAARLRELAPGMEVWKTSDPGLAKRIEQSYARVEPHRRRRCEVTVEARSGQPLVLRSGSVTVCGTDPLAPALRRQLTLADLREQLDRLGDTPFALGHVELLGDDGPTDTAAVMVPRSTLNALRRELVDALLATFRAPHPIADPDALRSLREEAKSKTHPPQAHRLRRWDTPELHRPSPSSLESTPPKQSGGVGQTAEHDVVSREDAGVIPHLSVLVRCREQLAPVLEALRSQSPAGLVYLDLPPDDLPAAIPQVRSAGLRAGLVGPRVFSPAQQRYVEELLALDADALLVRTLGTLTLLKERRGGWLAVADTALNVTNELAALALRRLGADRLTPAHDVEGEQLQRLLEATGEGLWELPVAWHEELFFTQYCLYAHRLGTGRGPDACGQPCARHDLELRDSRHRRYAIRPDALCRLSVLQREIRRRDGLDRLVRSAPRSVASVRVELLDETPEEIRGLLSGYGQGFGGGAVARPSKRP